MMLKDYISENPTKRVKIFSIDSGNITSLFSGKVNEIGTSLNKFGNCPTNNIISCGSNSAIVYIDGKKLDFYCQQVDQLKFI